MNRRDFAKGLIVVPVFLLRENVSAQAPQSTPSITPPIRGRLFTPLATSVTDSMFRDAANKEQLEAATFLYRVFMFEDDDDASITFDTVPNQVTSWAEAEKYYEKRFEKEISIGEVGDRRHGFLSDDGEYMSGILLNGNIIVEFTLYSPDVTDVYSKVVLPILNHHLEPELKLEYFPVGWEESWSGEDVSRHHIS